VIAEDVSLIVLAFEDGPALPGLVRELDRVLSASARQHEIILVDDGSSDGSAQQAEALCSEVPRLRVLRHEQNRGVGAAFRSGVSCARFAVVGYTDGDAQYSPSDLPSLLAALGTADAVSGVRVRRADPLHRRLFSLGYNLVLRLVYGLPLRDTNCGLKLFRRRFLDTALPIVSDGPFFDAEVMIKGLSAGLHVTEHVVRHLPRRFGRARGASLPSIRLALDEVSTPQMSRFVRRRLVARTLHRVLSLAGTAVRRGPARAR
jgi:glycosyltransferase involved in cell wall biosynthesis